VSITIRDERPEDIEAIRSVNDQACGQSQEGQLVDTLRKNGGVLLSLVAIADRRVVGHILYSPVSIESAGKDTIGAGLGPMAVLPEFQRQGIGSKLIESGKQRLREAGVPFIVVLGHPSYYPRFGFIPASKYGVRSEWEVPDNVFMMLVMDHETMVSGSGLAKYRSEFSSVA
jgi:putative acetyltransferase